MFKVNDINKAQDLNSSNKVKKSSSGADFSSYLRETLKSDNAPVSGVGGISVSEAVFAAQLADNIEEKEKKKKLIKRGNFLIEKLEDIRQALLNGYISMNKLIEISRFVKEQKFDCNDVKLMEIITEIELRVEVELAKLTK